MACETNCNSIPTFDCVTTLKQLFSAYTALSMGQSVYIAESSEPESQQKIQYNKADLPRVASLYNQLYKTCGTSLDASYPKILLIDANTKSTTRRGRPVRFTSY